MNTEPLTPCHVKKFGDTKSWSIYPEGAGKSVASVKDEAYARVMGASVDLLAAAGALVEGKDCHFDALNPCWNNRPTDVLGKHWGGGSACPVCTARAAIAKATK